MKYLILLMISLSICTGEVAAQLELEKGFVVTYQQDTIYGWIEARGDINSAKTCVFREAIEATPVRYAPEDIKVYRYDGSRYYVAMQLPDKKEKIFLEYLIDGVVDIFYYRDDEDDHYLMHTANSGIVELYDDEKIIYREGERFTLKSKKYVKQLKYALRETPELHTKIDRLTLSQKSLIPLIKTYHQTICNSEALCVLYEKQLPKSKMMLGALVGINFYSVNLKDHTALPFSFTQENVQYSNDDPIKHENVARTSYPSFGVFVNRSLPYVHKNLSLQYELVYNRQSIESRYSYSHPIRKINPVLSSEPFSETIVDNEIHLDMSYLSHSLMFKYVLNAYRFSPALYIGGFINTHISSSYQQNIKIFNTSQELLVESDFSGENLYNNKAGFIIANGLTCGIGTKVGISPRNHLLINLRYTRSFEMVGFEEAVSNNINLNLNLPILY